MFKAYLINRLDWLRCDGNAKHLSRLKGIGFAQQVWVEFCQSCEVDVEAGIVTMLPLQDVFQSEIVHLLLAVAADANVNVLRWMKIVPLLIAFNNLKA